MTVKEKVEAENSLVQYILNTRSFKDACTVREKAVAYGHKNNLPFAADVVGNDVVLTYPVEKASMYLDAFYTFLISKETMPLITDFQSGSMSVQMT